MSDEKLPEGFLSMEHIGSPPNSPASVPTPVQPQAKRKRGLLIGLIVLGFFVLAVGALGLVAYQRVFLVTPAQLLSTDTLAYISIATYQADHTDNPWNKLEQLVHYFPLTKDIKISVAADGMKKGLSQLFKNIVSIEKLPALGDEISLALTHMPQGTEQPGLLVFIPLKNPIELLQMLQQASDSSMIDIQPIPEEENVYKLFLKNQTQSDQIYVTLAGRYIVVGLRQEDITAVAQQSAWNNLVRSRESFADVPAYQEVVREFKGHQPLAWYVINQKLQNPIELASLFSSTSKKDEVKDASKYTSGLISAETDGIYTSFWMQDDSERVTYDPTKAEESLLGVLPEKIMDTWVSYYTEQHDVDKRIKAIIDATDEEAKKVWKENFQSTFGLDFEQDVLPVLSGQVAILVAPRYDGNPPHMALVIKSSENEATLKDKIEKIASSLKAQSEKNAMPIERSEEPFRNSSIVTLHMPDPNMMLVIPGISYATVGSTVIVSSDAQAVKELIDSLSGQGPSTALLKNSVIIEQLQKHPSELTGFTYLYPQGIVGVLKWAFCGSAQSGFKLCQIGEPTTEAIAEVISDHLLVTRTMSASYALKNKGISNSSFTHFVPLSAEEKGTYNEAAKLLGIDEEELRKNNQSAENWLQQLFLYMPQLFSARQKAEDARVKSNIGQLRTLAEVHYDNNKGSYAGFDKCLEAPSVATCLDVAATNSIVSLEEDTRQAVKDNSRLDVNATATEFCISHNLASTNTYICVDATGQFIESPTAICGVTALQCPH